jgi:hypothetical protein
MDLTKAYTRITLRGSCQPKACGGEGSIHVDHTMKLVSVLIYLNQAGGVFRTSTPPTLHRLLLLVSV